jgi:type II secretory ATPase GspE/PulE/Tfp pilus assembly ATPase PilB-like protein
VSKTQVIGGGQLGDLNPMADIAEQAKSRLNLQGQSWSADDVLRHLRMLPNERDEFRQNSNMSMARLATGDHAKMMKRLGAMIIGSEGEALQYASLLPLGKGAQLLLLQHARAVGLPVKRVSAVARPREEVMSWLASLTVTSPSALMHQADAMVRDTYSGPLVAAFLANVFQDAISSKASDVHFERSTESVQCWVSYRIDGHLWRRIMLPSSSMSAVCTRLKTMAGMDISEVVLAQDARSTVSFSGRVIDLRLSCVQRHDGESLTVRILDQESLLSLSSLLEGYAQQHEILSRVLDVRTKTGGIVIVSGPTGQGKSTTLSAMLTALARHRLKVMTIEDPVETRIPMVHQAGINDLSGSTFASLLKAYMRQDPDVLMVGEIRDQETAVEFLRGAETGHLMLSTVHTTDVASVFSRVRSLLPAELVSSSTFTLVNSLKALLNQRLVPKLCQCARPAESGTLSPSLFQALRLGDTQTQPVQTMEIVGCPVCRGKGYLGRALVLEGLYFGDIEARDRAVLAQLIDEDRVNDATRVKGVSYFSREDAVRRLLLDGEIDAPTARSALDLID